MKLPDAVIEKLRDNDSPVTHAAALEGGHITISYTCDGKAIGHTTFVYTPEAWLDWFRSMMEEMSPETVVGTKKVKARVKRRRTRASRSPRLFSRKRAGRRR
jgi:hypothetical protein